MTRKILFYPLFTLSFLFSTAQKGFKKLTYFSGDINSAELANIEITKLGLYKDKETDVFF